MSGGGLSKSRLARMRDVMAGYVERGEVPGLVLAVSRRGDALIEPIGAGDLDGTPIHNDTIFRISSMTKPITAAATMICVEECKLRLEDPVDGLLPELADRVVMRHPDGPLDDTVPASRPITVRDLLTFVWGLGMVIAPPGTYPIQQAMDDLQLGQGPPDPAVSPAPDEWIRRLGGAASARGGDPPPRHPAADASTRRRLDVQHRLGRAWRADRARHRPA